jgi:hypothetical protein
MPKQMVERFIEIVNDGAFVESMGLEEAVDLMYLTGLE